MEIRYLSCLLSILFLLTRSLTEGRAHQLTSCFSVRAGFAGMHHFVRFHLSAGDTTLGPSPSQDVLCLLRSLRSDSIMCALGTESQELAREGGVELEGWS